MKKNGILEELPELLNIPQFESIMTHKIEELKLMLKEEIELQKRIKNACEKPSEPLMIVCKDEGIIRETPYRFKLNLSEEGEWILQILFPALPTGKNLTDIFPPQLIKHLTRNSSEYFELIKLKEIILPELAERRFEARFVRFSHYEIAGSICEFRRISLPSPEENNPDQPNQNPVHQVIQVNDAFKQNPEDANYRELISYMEQCPNYKDHIFAEFFKKWKLLIDLHNIPGNRDK